MTWSCVITLPSNRRRRLYVYYFTYVNSWTLPRLTLWACTLSIVFVLQLLYYIYFLHYVYNNKRFFAFSLEFKIKILIIYIVKWTTLQRARYWIKYTCHLTNYIIVCIIYIIVLLWLLLAYYYSLFEWWCEKNELLYYQSCLVVLDWSCDSKRRTI